MSPNITKIVKKTMPAVVSIVISENIDDVLKSAPKRLINLRLKKKLKRFADGSGNIEVGGGSGFIVDEAGIILTNKHIVADKNAEYDIILNDGRKFKSEILARDPLNDIAILRIKNGGEKLPAAELGDSEKIELGEQVLAFGNAFGIFRNTVSAGIISGLSRIISARIDLDGPSQEMRGLIQTDAAINPGNSGGPLVDAKGKVVGINAVTVAGAENIGLAIPINAAKRDLSDLKNFGRIRTPLLGVRYLIIDEKIKDKMNLPVDRGALVINPHPRSDSAVIPDSPAARAGVKENDIILSINGEIISSDNNIGDFLEKHSCGDALKLRILRGRKEFEIKAILGERK